MMASSSRLLVRREHERLEGIEAWQRLDTRRHQSRHVSIWIKTRGASGAVGWWRWRARGVIVKLASRRSRVVKAACLSGGPVKS